jgi:hypothetical protein
MEIFPSFEAGKQCGEHACTPQIPPLVVIAVVPKDIVVMLLWLRRQSVIDGAIAGQSCRFFSRELVFSSSFFCNFHVLGLVLSMLTLFRIAWPSTLTAMAQYVWTTVRGKRAGSKFGSKTEGTIEFKPPA